MKHILLTLAVMAAVSLHGQYAFNTFTEPYQELSNDTEIELGTDWDDLDFTVPIGFTFSIGSDTYTEMVQGGPGAYFVFPTSSGSHDFGYFSNLANGADIGGSPSTISYTTEGEPGERICKLQYDNFAFLFEVYGAQPNSESRINFQIWLYESNSAIEFRFGENSIVASSMVHGPSGGPLIILVLDLNLAMETFEYGLLLSGDPMAPTTTTPILGEVQNQLAGNPENGRVYQFTPMPLGTENTDLPSFSIYPTLVEQHLNIIGDFEPLTAYRIFSLDGRLVLSGKLSAGILELGDLPSGSYVFHLEGSPLAARFIKN